MAHFEEQSKWPSQALSHLAVHAPIQVPPRCAEGGVQGFHPLPNSGWMTTPFPTNFQGQSPFFRPFPNQQQHQANPFPAFIQEEASKKVADWQNGNNNKVGQQIWQAEQQKATQWQPTAQRTQNESPSKINPFSLNNGSSSPLPAPQPIKAELLAPKAIHAESMDQMTVVVSSSLSPEEKHSEENPQSYEPSSHSMTDSDDLEERRLEVDVTSEQSPRSQSTPPYTNSDPTIEPRKEAKRDESTQDDRPPEQEAKLITPTPLPHEQKDDDPSHLLLNFSQQSFVVSNNSSLDIKPEIQEKQHRLAITTSLFPMPVGGSPTPATPASNGSSPTENSSFCRPPGLGPASLPTQYGAGHQPLTCPICGFSCPSKFHYNSHMNTHGDHKCIMCDYTSRTEGRLKKHMRDSHTVDEQLAAGLEIEPSPPVPNTQPSTPMPTICDSLNLSTTMANLVDVATSAANQTPITTNSIAGALGLEGLFQGFSNSGDLPSALDQIRAFTEKNPLLPDSPVNLASALGVMSQSMLGSPDNAELKANAEPRRNSNGKQKTYKCKQCPQVSMSKDEQWAHARTHIPLDKQMSCPKCNFVTEYKHHLEYHIRNHIGSKPFQCKKCAYTCVNKSMLNSHMKSHTNVYQFRCMDCTYATKYCHSLKLHLKKYSHRRVPDGTPMDDSSPTQVMSVESAFQRLPDNMSLDNGPFNPPTSLAQTLGLPPIIPNQGFNLALFRSHQIDQMNNLMSLSQPQLSCAVCEFKTASQDELIRHNMNHLLSQSNVLPLFPGLGSLTTLMPQTPMNEGIDVVKTEDDHEHEHEMTDEHDMPGSSGSSASPGGSSKSGDEENPSRKRKAFKLEQISQRLQGKSPSESDDSSHEHNDDEHLIAEPSSSPSDVLTDSVQNTPVIAQPVATHPNTDGGLNIFQKACLDHIIALQQKNVDNSDIWRHQCAYCKVAFQDQAMFHIHMGYHGYEHMYKCNRCGHHASNALQFSLHLLQASHE